ncbi:MAG TPA: HDOD domain-containing protein [Candidatus Kapabacteria bacterium]|nr:HDOD domain-containing protein [Candidatus Kapabacteria bacterium]
MLSPRIAKKLESIRDLPTVPIVISEVLSAIDDPKMSTLKLSQIIEKDQGLTARVLRVANSPFYGFSKRISTIDLAIVVMGYNALKEIVLSLVIKRFFSRISSNIFDIRTFWHYGLFCGSTSRLLARKLGYKIAGEAFVAGLMHDLGILVIAEYFSEDYKKIKLLTESGKQSRIEAEIAVLGSSHGDIGAWIADKWNLPTQISRSIKLHHTNYRKLAPTKNNQLNFDEIEEPLTAIVSLSEWFSSLLGFKNWINEKLPIEYYLSEELFPELSEHDFLDPESAFFSLKQEMIDEYNKACIYSEL